MYTISGKNMSIHLAFVSVTDEQENVTKHI